jgi:hypothetical protein
MSTTQVPDLLSSAPSYGLDSFDTRTLLRESECVDRTVSEVAQEAIKRRIERFFGHDVSVSNVSRSTLCYFADFLSFIGQNLPYSFDFKRLKIFPFSGAENFYPYPPYKNDQYPLEYTSSRPSIYFAASPDSDKGSSFFSIVFQVKDPFKMLVHAPWNDKVKLVNVPEAELTLDESLKIRQGTRWVYIAHVVAFLIDGKGSLFYFCRESESGFAIRSTLISHEQALRKIREIVTSNFFLSGYIHT